MIIEIDGYGKIEIDDSFADMSEDDQQQTLQEIMGSMDAGIAKSQSDGSEESQKLRSIAQGLTLGFSDEIEAAGTSAISKIGQLFGGEGKSYDQSLDEVRGKLDAYRENNPIEAIGYELGGAVVPALGAGLFSFGTGGAAVGTATAARVAPTLARAAKIGAIEGGIAGFGTGEGGFKDRAKSAAVGTALGGTFGAAVPVGVQQASKALKTIYKGAIPNRFGGGGLADAERKILAAFERDEITPDVAKQRLDEAAKLGVDDMTIADLGQSSQKQTWLAATSPNSMRNQVKDSLSARRLGQAENIADKTSEKMNIEGEIGINYLDELADKTRKQAAPLYEAAYKVDLDAKPFAALTSSKELQKAYREAVALAEIDPDVNLVGNMPKNLDAFFGDTITRGEKVTMPTEVAHQIKIGLDSLIEKEITTVVGASDKVSKKGRALIKLKNSWNNQIAKQNDAYKNANANYADNQKLNTAYKTGVDVIKLRNDVLYKKVSKMLPAEKEAFRVGLVSQIQELAMKTGDVSDFTKTIFGSPKKRAAMRLAFDNKADFKNFEKFIKLESNKIKTYNEVYGGSQTADKAIEMAGTEFDPQEGLSILSQYLNNPQTAGTSILKSMGRRGQGLNEETSNNMLKILTEKNPNRQRIMLDALNQRKMLDQQKANRLTRRPEIYSGLLGSQSSSLFAKEE